MADHPLSTVEAFSPRVSREHESGRMVDLIQNIAVQDAYSRFSPEELRANDYLQGNKVNTSRSNLATALLNNAILPRLVLPDDSSDPIRERPDLGNTIINFRVGVNPTKDFALHECLVTHDSEFVRRALEKDWKEANDRTILLPDDEPSVFELYQDWLYDRKVYTKVTSAEYERLVKVYLFGEKLLDVHFKNAVIREIARVLRASSLFDITLTNKVYDSTPPGSALRKLFRDVYSWLGSESRFDNDDPAQSINAEFLRDVNRDLMRRRAQAPESTSLPFGTRGNVTKNYIQDETAEQAVPETTAPSSAKREHDGEAETASSNKQPRTS